MSEPAPRLSPRERLRQTIDRRPIWQTRIIKIFRVLMQRGALYDRTIRVEESRP